MLNHFPLNRPSTKNSLPPRESRRMAIRRPFPRALFLIATIVFFSISTPTPAQSIPASTDEGITIPIADGFLNVTVRTDNILHIMYAKDKSFFSHTSVDALPRPPGVLHFAVTSDPSTTTIKTANLQAQIDLKSGSIRFLDPAGQTILAEKARTLEPATVQDETTNHIRQQWLADPAESLYGLGQMQLGLTNIKNWDLDLWQHNGTVVVPFLVSSKGYGILWDNTSYSRFGDLTSFTTIPANNLLDNTGTPGNLSTGKFASANAPIQNPATAPSIAITPGGRGAGRSRPTPTRWEGKLAPTVSGDYQFQAYSNGTIRTWIDGKLVMDHFRQSWLPWYDVARVNLQAGKQYPIKIEWSPDTQGNQFQFKWKLPVADRDEQGTSLWSEVGSGIDYYFCYGPSLDKVISGFRNITGRANMLPNWSLGYWQSKDHFTNQQQSIDAVKKFRDEKIPLDTIVQDWQYWPGASLDTVGSWAFDATRYPDPLAWTKAIHDLHAHLMISVWGWISSKSQPDTNYQQMLEKKYLLGTAGRDARTFADFFNPDAAKLFWTQLNSELFNKGIDAWWLDAAEPDIAGTPTLDAMRTLMNPNGMGTGAKMLNAYPLMESKAIYEGQRATAPDQRVFILTRSGFPGMQRYSAAVWSGDTTSTWPAMRQQIQAGLGYSISGMPWWSMDIGGYQLPPRFTAPNNGRPRNPADAEEWDELQTRWFQFGTFVPIMRVHGQGNREIYNFGPTAQAAMIKYDQLRYALMPYIYSLAGSVTQNDDTIMRPLVMDFPADEKVPATDDEYMFGPAFLCNPVSEYKARTRSVYLPQGTNWYEFWTGKPPAAGSTIEADAPYDSMPLFIKAGSIIPTGPVQQYVCEKPADALTIYVYTGASGAFTLYEDEGVNFNYEKGAFTQIPITWDDAVKKLTIGKRQGLFAGMIAERTFNVIFVTPDKPTGFAFDAKADHSVHYSGDAVTVSP